MNFPLQAPRMRAAARRAKAGGERFLGGILPGATARRLQVAAFADEWAASNLDARHGSGPLWVVLGDSISQGIGATTRESGYVGVMHEMLRRRDAWRVVNLSRAEAGVLDVLARQLPELISLGATNQIALVTCLIGAEDMARRTPGLDTALRQVISALPTGSVIGLLPHGPRAAGALNSVIREEAEKHAMRIAVLPPRLPGQLRGRDNRGLGDVGHAAWARAVLTAADGPVAVAAPATDPRLPIVPPLEDHSPPTDPAMPVVPPLDPAAETDRLSLDAPAAGPAFDEEAAAVEALDEAALDDAALDEPVVTDVAGAEPVVGDEPLTEEPVVDEVVADELAVEELPAEELAAAEPRTDDEPEVAPAVEEPVAEVEALEVPETDGFAGPAVEHDDIHAGSSSVEERLIDEPVAADEVYETGPSYSAGSSYADVTPEPEVPAADAESSTGLGWAERFGTTEREAGSNGWAAEFGTDVEPVAGIEPVADDEPLEVEVDTVGDPAADPAEDVAEPTAVESPVTGSPADEPAVAETTADENADDSAGPDRTPAADVDLFAPTPPATDAPRAYGNGDRGPNESGADRAAGYAERADRH